MNVLRILSVFVGFYIALGFAQADERPANVSKVRQAAIEKMKSKLGVIRGSIDQDSRRVYLTESMIEQLKPIRPVEENEPTVNAQFDGLTDEELLEYDVDATPEQIIEAATTSLAANEAIFGRRREREIYQAVGIAAGETQDSLVTNSTSAGTLPDTADLDEIVKAVDRMVAETESE